MNILSSFVKVHMLFMCWEKENDVFLRLVGNTEISTLRKLLILPCMRGSPRSVWIFMKEFEAREFILCVRDVLSRYTM